MKKLYYIYRVPHGCMGGLPQGHLDSEIFTSQLAAEKELHQTEGSIRWVSWQWDDENGRREIAKLRTGALHINTSPILTDGAQQEKRT